MTPPARIPQSPTGGQPGPSPLPAAVFRPMGPAAGERHAPRERAPSSPEAMGAGPPIALYTIRLYAKAASFLAVISLEPGSRVSPAVRGCYSGGGLDMQYFALRRAQHRRRGYISFAD